MAFFFVTDNVIFFLYGTFFERSTTRYNAQHHNAQIVYLYTIY
jgi:hypothetical protein